MTRSTLGSANRAASAAQAVRIVELAAIALPSATLYLAGGDTPVTFGGHTYLPTGVLGGIGAAEETGDLKPRTVTLSLSGADPALIAELRSTSWQFSRVDVWIGFLDEDGALVADPYALAPSMVASSASISLGAGTAAISFEVETDDIYLQRNSAVLATDAAQRRRYAGDTGLSKVTAIADATIEWGGQRQSPGGTYDPFGRFGAAGGRT